MPAIPKAGGTGADEFRVGRGRQNIRSVRGRGHPTSGIDGFARPSWSQVYSDSQSWENVYGEKTGPLRHFAGESQPGNMAQVRVREGQRRSRRSWGPGAKEGDSFKKEVKKLLGWSGSCRMRTP